MGTNYAALAPSIHNTQPWQFRIDGASVLLLADSSKQLLVADPLGRQLTISCGAALHNLDVALRYFELKPNIELCPISGYKDCIARVSIDGTHICTDFEATLFHAIKKRQTTRAAFLPTQLDDKLAAELTNSVSTDTNTFTVVRDSEIKAKLMDLVLRADSRLLDNSEYQDELFSWIQTNSNVSEDGMSLDRLELPDINSGTSSRTPSKQNNQGNQQTSLHEKADSILVGLLSSHADSPTDWMKTGQALSRILLRAAADGLSASFINQPIDEASLRPEISKVVGIEGYPQMLILLGMASTTQQSKRRPADEI